MITGEDKEKFLKQNVFEFDQGPDGWRALDELTSGEYQAELILYYIEHSGADFSEEFDDNGVMKPIPVGLLYFHAGQAYACSGSRYYREAIECFKQGYEMDDENAAECWNAYVDGTIAFLKENKQEIDKQILIVENSKAKNKNGGNIGLLTKFSKSIELGITDYLRACTMPVEYRA